MTGRILEDAAVTAREDLGCLRVSLAVDAAAVLSSISALLGFEFPIKPGTVSSDSQGFRALWLTPRVWLLECPLDREEALARMFDSAFLDKRVHAAEYSDQLSWFELSGKESLELLTSGGFVSLEREGLAVGRVKRTGLAGIESLVFRERPERWRVAVERSRARYFSKWLETELSGRWRAPFPVRTRGGLHPEM